ncbi:MAG: hypothetical protein GC191_21125 [Azospirillum sp.]|nr:hypothetical protein [Azospirillum sp.]
MAIRVLAVAVLAFLIAGPAMATSCPKHMKHIDEVMAGHLKLSAEQMNEVQSYRMEGQRLHQEGKHAESLAALARAEAILGIK